MDNVDHARDVYAGPECTCRDDPTAMATGPLLEQLLLVCSRGLVKRAVHLLGHALSLAIAPDVDHPTCCRWQWQSADQRLGGFPQTLGAVDNTIPDRGPPSRLPVDLGMREQE